MNSLRKWAGVLARQWTWLKWIVAGALLVYLFDRHRADLERLGEHQIDWRFAALALMLCASAIVSTFVRWYLLVWAQDFAFRLSDALRIGFIGYLFNYVAPGAVGGDLVKAVIIAREQTERRVVAMATVFLDRVLGLIGLFLVGAAAGLIATPLRDVPQYRTVLVTFTVAGLCGLLGMAVVLHPAIPRARWVNALIHLPKVGGMIGGAINAVRLYQSRWMVLVAAVGISVVGHLMMLSSFYFVARALNPAEAIPSFAAHLQFIPAAELAGVIVPLPGGIGALEGAVAYYYEVAGSSSGEGFLTGIGYRAITVIVAAVGAGYYLAARREVDEAMEEATHESTGVGP